jgi:hypothetical protein
MEEGEIAARRRGTEGTFSGAFISDGTGEEVASDGIIRRFEG